MDNIVTELILEARRRKASDVHLSFPEPPMFRVDGVLAPAGPAVSRADLRRALVALTPEGEDGLPEKGRDVDFALTTPDGCRQRVNLYVAQGELCATIRLLNDHIPPLEDLGLPPVLRRLAALPRGLVLVTGPTGSGKSTTLAAMIEYINQLRPEHIITIEDPIEYVYQRKTALIHQRELGRDTVSFASALRSALREDPDIILVGEMRDYETISAALTAAETGHLVLSTLHTTGAAQTVDRIIDACPAQAQSQVRTQLTGVLGGVVTQCLLPAFGGGRVVATEILTGTDAVMNMIRENKCFQLSMVMQAGAGEGMHTLNGDLVRLVAARRISRETATRCSNSPRELAELLR